MPASSERLNRGGSASWIGRTVSRAFVILFIAAIPAGLTAFFHPNRPALDGGAGRIPEVTLNAARAWGADVLWVDARRLELYEAAHIEGAVHLSHETFDANLVEFGAVWSPGMRVVVYCDSRDCGASRDIAARLAEGGVTDVYILGGGWSPPADR